MPRAKGKPGRPRGRPPGRKPTTTRPKRAAVAVDPAVIVPLRKYRARLERQRDARVSLSEAIRTLVAKVK